MAGVEVGPRPDRKWRQVSARLYGDNKTRSAHSIRRSGKRVGETDGPGSGHGDCIRAIQGFRYMGERQGVAARLQEAVKRTAKRLNCANQVA